MYHVKLVGHIGLACEGRGLNVSTRLGSGLLISADSSDVRLPPPCARQTPGAELLPSEGVGQQVAWRGGRGRGHLGAEWVPTTASQALLQVLI